MFKSNIVWMFPAGLHTMVAHVLAGETQALSAYKQKHGEKILYKDFSAAWQQMWTD